MLPYDNVWENLFELVYERKSLREMNEMELADSALTCSLAGSRSENDLSSTTRKRCWASKTVKCILKRKRAGNTGK